MPTPPIPPKFTRHSVGLALEASAFDLDEEPPKMINESLQNDVPPRPESPIRPLPTAPSSSLFRQGYASSSFQPSSSTSSFPSSTKGSKSKTKSLLTSNETGNRHNPESLETPEEAVQAADLLLRNPRFRPADDWDLSRDATSALGEESILMDGLDKSSADLLGVSMTAGASSTTNSREGNRRHSLTNNNNNNRTILADLADRKPSRKSGAYADRFIPSRSVSNFDAALRQDDSSFLMTASSSANQGEGGSFVSTPGGGSGGNSGSSPQRATGAAALFQMLLRSELLGEDPVFPSAGALEERSPRLMNPPIPSTTATMQPGTAPPIPAGAGHLTPGPTPIGTPSLPVGPVPGGPTPGTASAAPPTPSVLRFRRPVDVSALGAVSIVSPEPVQSSPLSPLRPGSRHLLQSSPGGTPLSARRRIPRHPFKVLDAPGLADDFYLNVVDWSAKNVVAVGLGSSIYLWSAHTARATRLDDLVNDDLACVSFTESGASVAVGTRAGRILMYDAERCTLLRTFEEAHSGRVGCASWNGPILATGSRDRRIRERDTRLPPTQALIRNLAAHRQEVCGLKYSFEGLTGPHRQLASGGNDNRLLVWDARRSDEPLFRFGDHIAAVKALAWSHQTGILASGGGTADRCIRVWSTLYGTSLSCLDTGSQVCGLVYSKTVPELVSTHGYSLNQVCVWRTPSPQAPIQKLATLQGHTMRVLYLALSPDGSTIVTGAGDESLRFWSLWPGRSVATSNGALVMVGGSTGLR